MVKLDFFLNIFFKTPLFGHMLKKNQHIHFFGAWAFLFGHIQFTPSEGPKGFVNSFFLLKTVPWNLDHQVAPWKITFFHGPTSWSMM